MTPAMLAVQKNHLFILRMLREAGSNLKKTLDTQGGINLVYIAAQNGHDVIVSYLIDKSSIKDGNLYFDKNE
jgi:ankyrin repeat protein